MTDDAPSRALGAAALVGCAAVLVCDLVMWFLVRGYDPVAQTISELGAGPHHAIQDTGLTLFAVGILALGVALVRRRPAGARGWLVTLGVFALAAVVAVIALRNEYGDGDTGGLVIHRYLVGALYVLVAILLWFARAAFPGASPGMLRYARLAAAAWALLAPLFYVVPESVNGAYERGLGLFLVAVVGLAAITLRRSPPPV